MGGCSSKNRKKDFSPTKEGNGKHESHSVDPHPQDVCKPQSIAQPPPEPSPDAPQGKRKLLLHSTHYLISVCCSVRVVCCTGGVELKRCVPRCRVLCSKKIIHRHPSSFSHSCHHRETVQGHMVRCLVSRDRLEVCCMHLEPVHTHTRLLGVGGGRWSYSELTMLAVCVAQLFPFH